MEKVSRVGRILLFIPVLFVLLRVWAVVQYFYTIYLTHLTDESGHCIPSDPHKTIHVVLGVLQVRFNVLLYNYCNCFNLYCMLYCVTIVCVCPAITEKKSIRLSSA